LSPKYEPKVKRDKEAVLSRFRDVIKRHHEYAQEWKAITGSRVVGYLCTYVPEEVLYAAGVLPVRVIGTHEPEDITEPHIYSMLCSYCRDCLAQGLQGRYNYLDGILTTHGCVHIRHTLDSWQRHIPISYSRCIYVPQCVHQKGAKDALAYELKNFKESLEKWLEKAVTEEDLVRAIEVYNTDRRLMTRVYEMRKQDNPPITGVQVMEMVMASQLMDKAEHARIVEELLEILPGENTDGGGDRVRILLVGQTDNPELVEFIESLGAVVVADDLCFGWRYFCGEVPQDKDPLYAIASRYIDRPPCPMKDLKAPRMRLPYMVKLAEEYRVQGVIHVRQRFCDPHGYEVPSIRRVFQERGIPVLALEQDITTPLGQLQTRIEAHLEVIRSEA